MEVLSRRGLWVAGFRLLQFRADGLATIRSERTGKTEHLPPDHWRDPLETEALAQLRGAQ